MSHKIYLCGGAVRDEIMGREPKDLDYVVVGATPEEMLNMGYTQVGADFPVFLNPTTGDEYALARTEYRDGEGYQGFKCTFGPDVTLEDDLGRRDLTINAIAKDIITGEIFDPYNGRDDIKAGILRPTTSAFADDPVRLLRAARFLARYPEFSASVDLFDVMGEMVAAGELENLTPERVWQEMEKALGEKRPSRFFIFLQNTGLFPELEAMKDVQEHNRYHPEYDVFKHIMLSIDYAARYDDPITVFGALCHDFGKPKAYELTGGAKSTMHEKLGVKIVEAFCERWKVPNDYKYMALKASEFHTHCHLAFDMKPKTIHKFMKQFKDQSWFCRLLEVAVSDKSGRGKPACDWVYTQPSYLYLCWMRAFITCDTKAISASMLEQGKSGPAIGEAIKRAQIAAIAAIDKSVYKEPYDACHAAAFAIDSNPIG